MSILALGVSTEAGPLSWNRQSSSGCRSTVGRRQRATSAPSLHSLHHSDHTRTKYGLTLRTLSLQGGAFRRAPDIPPEQNVEVTGIVSSFYRRHIHWLHSAIVGWINKCRPCKVPHHISPRVGPSYCKTSLTFPFFVTHRTSLRVEQSAFKTKRTAPKWT